MSKDLDDGSEGKQTTKIKHLHEMSVGQGSEEPADEVGSVSDGLLAKIGTDLDPALRERTPGASTNHIHY